MWGRRQPTSARVFFIHSDPFIPTLLSLLSTFIPDPFIPPNGNRLSSAPVSHEPRPALHADATVDRRSMGAKAVYPEIRTSLRQPLKNNRIPRSHRLMSTQTLVSMINRFRTSVYLPPISNSSSSDLIVTGHKSWNLLTFESPVSPQSRHICTNLADMKTDGLSPP